MDVKATIDFTSLSDLGSNGCNSQVFLGYDPQLNANLVFKRIEKRTFPQSDKFFQEAHLLYAGRHPHVMEVKYACQDCEYIWIAMPHCAQGSLQGLISQRFLTPREVILYSIGFLTGLNHIHSKGLLHLDIKPSNILISDTNTAILADFGCSQVMDEHFLAEPLKTYPLHQVPERLGANPASKLGIEADIYQAGLTVYRLANGDDLFFEPIGGRASTDELKDQKVRNKLNEKIRKGKYPQRDAYLPHVPEKLRRTIVKATAVNPDDRYSCAADFINDLSAVKNCLDWQYEKSPRLDRFVLSDRSRSIDITVKPDGGKYEILTQKTVHPTGEPRKVANFCSRYKTREEALKSVKNITEQLAEE